MSEWNQEPQQEQPQSGNAPQEPMTAPTQEQEAPAAKPMNESKPTWQAPASHEPTEPTPSQPTWQAPASYEPTEPAPSQPTWQVPTTPEPPRSPFSAQHSSYTSGTPYYGSATPAPSGPTNKRSVGSSIAIAVLAVFCCVSLVLTSVLAIKLLSIQEKNQNGNPNASQQPIVNGNQEGDREIIENGPTLEITDVEALDDGGLATSEIVKRNLDATVVLTMYTKTTNSFYGYYYGDGSGDLTEAGGASGIVLSADGYIITNSHCVFNEETQKKYDRIDVTLYDGRIFEGAEVIGYDPTTDLAVIKIDATDLSPAEFGDSSALSLGDRVVTLGNSGGLAWTVSQGILSGQARDVYEDTGYAIKCLQVDAIINPGSSGGPLINAFGQVVGVNSAKIVLTGYEGLGFSIPINEAKEVIDDLIKYGYVTGRVSLGITGRTVTSIGYEGFMIQDIFTNSSLVGTKAQSGDIITHVDQKRVTDYAELRAELTSHEVGDTVTLTLLRLDRQTRKTVEFDVTVELVESR